LSQFFTQEEKTFALMTALMTIQKL